MGKEPVGAGCPGAAASFPGAGGVGGDSAGYPTARRKPGGRAGEGECSSSVRHAVSFAELVAIFVFVLSINSTVSIMSQTSLLTAGTVITFITDFSSVYDTHLS